MLSGCIPPDEDAGTGAATPPTPATPADEDAGTGAATPPTPATPAPEIAAAQWLNSAEPITLAGLRGQVVVVEFWATWCPPCRVSIPHLITLYQQYKDRGVTFVGLTDEDRNEAKVDEFVKSMKIPYVIGTGSDSGEAYGVSAIPTAFVIAKDGTISWRGHPMKGLDTAIAKALQ